MKNLKKLIILTGPSGVGKGTVVKEILDKDKIFAFQYQQPQEVLGRVRKKVKTIIF